MRWHFTKVEICETLRDKYSITAHPGFHNIIAIYFHSMLYSLPYGIGHGFQQNSQRLARKGKALYWWITGVWFIFVYTFSVHVIFRQNVPSFPRHSLMNLTFMGDKVSMLTHIWPYKPLTWWRLKWLSAITRLTAHFTCGLVSSLVICKV